MVARKWCFVPGCPSTTHRTPNKIFVCIPRQKENRKKWLVAVKRDINGVSPATTLYCCEDHFDLAEDMDNYCEFKLSKVKARMKPGVVPHIFNDHQQHENKYSGSSNNATSRKKRISKSGSTACIDNETMIKIEPSTSIIETEPNTCVIDRAATIKIEPSTSFDIPGPEDNKNSISSMDFSCQAGSIEYRSKATQLLEIISGSITEHIRNSTQELQAQAAFLNLQGDDNFVTLQSVMTTASGSNSPEVFYPPLSVDAELIKTEMLDDNGVDEEEDETPIEYIHQLKRQRTDDSINGQEINDADDSSSEVKVVDEFFYFGKNVECQLRQMSLDKALECQFKILEILAQYRNAT